MPAARALVPLVAAACLAGGAAAACATDAAQGNAQSNALSALLPLHAEFNLAARPSSRFHHFSPHMPAKTNACFPSHPGRVKAQITIWTAINCNFAPQLQFPRHIQAFSFTQHEL